MVWLLVGVFGERHQYLPMSIFSTTHTLEQAFLLKVGKVELVLHNPYTIWTGKLEMVLLFNRGTRLCD